MRHTTSTAALKVDDVGTARDFAHKLSDDLLVVFDNLETAMDGDRAGVRLFFTDLLAYSKQPRFLVTTRERIRLGDECHREVTRLDRVAARQLFRELATNKGYRWQDDGDAILERLLISWDDMPLLIVLGADRLIDDGSLEMLEQRWKERGNVALRPLGLKDEDRHHLNDANYVYLLSYLQLPEGTARRLFGIFGWLPAGASQTMMEHLFPDDWEDSISAMQLKSLAQRSDTRWTMLSPIREFAVRLQWEGRQEDEERLEAYLTDFAERHGDLVGSVSVSEALEPIGAELPNLHALMDRCSELIRGHLAERLSRYYDWASPVEGKRRLTSGIESAESAGQRDTQANFIQRLGDVHLSLSEYPQARQRYEEALPFYSELGNRLGEANCIQRLGDVHRMLDEYPRARQRYEQALPLYRELGDRLGEANCIKRLGDVHRMLDEYLQARQRYEEALPFYSELGNRLGEANCIRSLGDVHLCLSEYLQARQRYERALSFYRDLRARLGEANCIQRLGDVHLSLSEYPQARRRYEQALPLYRELGDRLGEANCIQSLGDVLRKRIEYSPDQARRYRQRSGE